jgi:hypothetical protein
MVLSIKITTTEYDSEKTPAEQVDEAMAALGFVRKTSAVSLIMGDAKHVARELAETVIYKNGPEAEPGSDTRGVMNVGLEHEEAAAKVADATAWPSEGYGLAQSSTVATAPTAAPDPDYTHPSGRKFGQPGPGGKRRTKAEMAEDTAYLEALDAAAKGAVFVTNTPRVGEPNDPRREQEGIPIQAGEDFDLTRDAPVFDATIDAQDAADEAAEAELSASRPPDPEPDDVNEQTGELTLEDLRREIGLYVKKHGMAKASANNPAIIEGPMLEVTDFERAIGRVKLATAASDGLLHEADAKPHATKDDLMEAVMAYAAKYEGVGVKPASGGPTAVDLADVMRKTFPGTSGALSEIPATPEGYGKALGAVNAAITGNPYKREVK